MTSAARILLGAVRSRRIADGWMDGCMGEANDLSTKSSAAGTSGGVFRLTLLLRRRKPVVAMGPGQCILARFHACAMINLPSSISITLLQQQQADPGLQKTALSVRLSLRPPLESWTGSL
jgi:hypothetical protein